jgi:hypothetical protein
VTRIPVLVDLLAAVHLLAPLAALGSDDAFALVTVGHLFGKAVHVDLLPAALDFVVRAYDFVYLHFESHVVAQAWLLLQVCLVEV